MNKLIDIKKYEDIPALYQKTPLGLLLEYHNLGKQFEAHSSAELLIGMCMDNRKQLRLPQNFSFIVRIGGTNIKPNQFHISYAVGVGGVRHIALIGHTQCGMVNIADRKEKFIQGMISNAGWTQAQAEEHFAQWEPICEIGNEVEFIKNKAQLLQSQYPNILIAPLIYKIEDQQLYLVQ